MDFKLSLITMQFASSLVTLSVTDVTNVKYFDQCNKYQICGFICASVVAALTVPNYERKDFEVVTFSNTSQYDKCYL